MIGLAFALIVINFSAFPEMKNVVIYCILAQSFEQLNPLNSYLLYYYLLEDAEAH